MNISFTEKQERYLRDQIDSGDYKNVSEVVRDALRLHEIYRNKVIADLQKEIAKGWDGPARSISAQEIVDRK